MEKTENIAARRYFSSRVKITGVDTVIAETGRKNI